LLEFNTPALDLFDPVLEFLGGVVSVRCGGGQRGDVLWVHAGSQIARPRADFDRFSENAEPRRTGWWSEMNSNWRTTS
jgi:hypothetical protein